MQTELNSTIRDVKKDIICLKGLIERFDIYDDCIIESCSLSDFWKDIHPKILEITKSRFDSEHYADAVESALKEINSSIKNLVKRKTGKELDGADLMHTAFSPKTPIIVLGDLSTETGKNIQKGYMEIFAGAMIGIRNPKAHDNIKINAIRAKHFIYLASLLMYKFDERI